MFEPGIPADEANARRDRAKTSVARLEKEFEELTAEARQKRERWRKAMVRALFEVEDAHQGEAAGPAPASSELAKAPMQRQRYQEQEILRVIRELGYDPQHLPPNPAGKPGVRATVRDSDKLPTMTPKVFEKAWQRLRDSGEIADSQ